MGLYSKHSIAGHHSGLGKRPPWPEPGEVITPKITCFYGAQRNKSQVHFFVMFILTLLYYIEHVLP